MIQPIPMEVRNDDLGFAGMTDGELGHVLVIAVTVAQDWLRDNNCLVTQEQSDQLDLYDAAVDELMRRYEWPEAILFRATFPDFPPCEMEIFPFDKTKIQTHDKVLLELHYPALFQSYGAA